MDILKTHLALSTDSPLADITAVRIEKRSIDARAKLPGYRIQGKLYLGEPGPAPVEVAPFKKIGHRSPVYIVGAGPAGLFAAIRLLQSGIKPIILERGKSVRDRRRDLAILNREGLVNAESNYCFGEGGAGTYSDGKLYTRSGNRVEIMEILTQFIHYGADPDIEVDARPHIGTNRLPELITSIREAIVEAGGEIHFGQKLTSIVHAFGKVTALVTNGDQRWACRQVILATGHSARDIYFLLLSCAIRLEAKPFAVGIRVEHTQTLIDTIQYHSPIRDGLLPPAYYSVKEQVNERGVFSFCMCPGGIIAPCATGQDQVVTNGWSPSKRNNPFSNSGIVVQVELSDMPPVRPQELVLKGLFFQEAIEKKAALAGGGLQKAPGQRLVDFTTGRYSADLPACSYLPGLTSASFSEVLPSWILARLQQAFPRYENKMKGYYTNEAVVVGVESRTSSPVRIPRDPIHLMHPDLEGLYPCGEGAGYAGGILSAALDGYKIADQIGQGP